MHVSDLKVKMSVLQRKYECHKYQNSTVFIKLNLQFALSQANVKLGTVKYLQNRQILSHRVLDLTNEAVRH